MNYWLVTDKNYGITTSLTSYLAAGEGVPSSIDGSNVINMLDFNSYLFTENDIVIFKLWNSQFKYVIDILNSGNVNNKLNLILYNDDINFELDTIDFSNVNYLYSITIDSINNLGVNHIILSELENLNKINIDLLNGLESLHFFNLVHFNTFDLSNKFPNLAEISIQDCWINSILLPNNTNNLKTLYLNNNNFTSFDISKYENISSFSIENNPIIQLDISNTNIYSFNQKYDTLEKLIAKNIKYNDINLECNKLSYLDISGSNINDLQLSNCDILDDIIGFTSSSMKNIKIFNCYKLNLSFLNSHINYLRIDNIDKIFIFNMSFDKLELSRCNMINDQLDLVVNKEVSISSIRNLEKINITGNYNSLSIEFNIDLKELNISNNIYERFNIYQNINLSKIILSGVEYGEYGSDNDIMKLFEVLQIPIKQYSETVDLEDVNFISSFNISFNKLCCKNISNYFGINPFIVDNKVLGNPWKFTNETNHAVLTYINLQYMNCEHIDEVSNGTTSGTIVFNNICNLQNKNIDFTDFINFNHPIALFHISEETKNNLKRKLNKDKPDKYFYIVTDLDKSNFSDVFDKDGNPITVINMYIGNPNIDSNENIFYVKLTI